MNSPQQRSTALHNSSPQVETAVRQPYLTSQSILQGQRVVEINHNGSTYKLQATRLGKLILTK